MSDSSRIKSRLNRALCAFVSVPLSALPVAAQDGKLPDRIPGRTQGRTQIRIDRSSKIRVPGRTTIGKRLTTGARIDGGQLRTPSGIQVNRTRIGD